MQGTDGPTGCASCISLQLLDVGQPIMGLCDQGQLGAQVIGADVVHNSQQGIATGCGPC